MKKYDILFCDLDGTLIETISGEVFPKGVWDMKLRFDVLDAIKKLNLQYILIASNQGGIESGIVNEFNFRTKLEYITKAIWEYCDCECYGAYCSTNDRSNPWRKPNTKMLEALLDDYVGDDINCD